MKFTETKLKGCFIVELEPILDDRGFFARSWCSKEFATHGLHSSFVQCNVSFNERKGTLRGMHYQSYPYEESKLVRCTRGAIYDVVIDLRVDSPTYKQWIGVDLTEDNGAMIFIPEGFAHGFQTLIDRTEVFYHMGQFFHPEASYGIRWDDPIFGIRWPHEKDRIISDKDLGYSGFVG
ncbi:dTDP-4-dehydrorhamnose 3,5-epimerase [Paenibacillus sp. GSMTC-2017]|uniref:dTDP-4-dehydrorhamnose 3,5-epimerase n=1 Tax=Paenibacillus sp. GSMTC-2017 TaxID=2794350 RepID=UPI0018D8137D|nr:dTDP-4-dehydrorhamnose 3,5-epimerase [Paenibacillus sp. GSMTC-2017]MBH5320634.1 dTDP-4-dehydrorhamnose 3,5-epimerase [Paenibacillus sp. GSMTC-2017]